MADIITYNNIISVFEDIANRHYQIKTFKVGDQWEEDANTVQYPMLVVNPTSANMARSANDMGYATFEITMNVLVSDQVYKGEENENDVISDTLQMIQDIIVEFNQHPYYTNSRFDIIGDLDFEPFTERNDDEVSGWEVGMTLRTPNIRKFCGIPVSEINGFEFDRPSSGTSGAVGGTCLCIKSMAADSPIIIDENNGNYNWSLSDSFLIASTTGQSSNVQLPFIFSNTGINSVIPSFGTYNGVNLTALSSAILGGNYNSILSSGVNSVILNGDFNILDTNNSAILSANNSSINTGSTYSIIGTGTSNSISLSEFSAILNGNNNGMFQSDKSTILNGRNNNITSSNYATILGGQGSDITSSAYGITGGRVNRLITSPQSLAIGGRYNIITTSTDSSILGGYTNTITSSDYSSIVGGLTNTIETAPKSFIGGGEDNTITGSNHSSIVSGKNNSIESTFFGFTKPVYVSILGGKNNIIKGLSNYSSILGGGRSGEINDNNVIYSSKGSIIGNGIANYITYSGYSIIGSGSQNVASYSYYSNIGTGKLNTITSNSKYSSILNGKSNEIQTSTYSSILGGQSNNITSLNNVYILGSNITATVADTTYVNNLNINDVPNTATTSDVLVRESDGEITVLDLAPRYYKAFSEITTQITGGNPTEFFIHYNSEDLNSGHFSTSGVAEIVIEEDGIYEISTNFSYNGQLNGVRDMVHLKININGTDTDEKSYGYNRDLSAGTGNVVTETAHLDTIFNLSVNDVIKIKGIKASTDAINPRSRESWITIKKL